MKKDLLNILNEKLTEAGIDYCERTIITSFILLNSSNYKLDEISTAFSEGDVTFIDKETVKMNDLKWADLFRGTPIKISYM